MKPNGSHIPRQKKTKNKKQKTKNKKQKTEKAEKELTRLYRNNDGKQGASAGTKQKQNPPAPFWASSRTASALLYILVLARRAARQGGPKPEHYTATDINNYLVLV